MRAETLRHAERRRLGGEVDGGQQPLAVLLAQPRQDVAARVDRELRNGMDRGRHDMTAIVSVSGAPLAPFIVHFIVVRGRGPDRRAGSCREAARTDALLLSPEAVA